LLLNDVFVGFGHTALNHKVPVSIVIRTLLYCSSILITVYKAMNLKKLD